MAGNFAGIKLSPQIWYNQRSNAKIWATVSTLSDALGVNFWTLTESDLKGTG